MSIEWAQLVLNFVVSLASAGVGLFVGVWKWGKSSAKDEQSVKEDYTGKIAALREEVKMAMADQAKSSGARVDLLVEQFKESFDGIRRQIDEHRFYTEKDFMKKEDFKDFREEYRDDMRDLKASIAQIARAQ